MQGGLFDASAPGAPVVGSGGESLLEIADRIARAPTGLDRSGQLDLVAPAFRELVGKLAADMIAAEIWRLPGREARRAALADVPVELVDRVTSRVTMLIQSRAALRMIEAARAPGAVLL